jgi:two-component system, LytTR family, sensor kinase
MKISIDKKRFIFYVWVGLVFLLLWLLHDFSKYPNTFPPRIPNNIWRTVYVTVINFILFEYSIPYIRQRKGSIIATIIIALFLLWVHMMLYSYGLYVWRAFGIILHVWTPLIEFKSLSHGLSNQMAYSMSSFFFFGIIRHVYGYIQLTQAAQQLRIEKQEAELSYLKSQTNPHFLFNTLNNIYSLSRDKSDLAPESILRLSKILRFMLYETSGAYIAIEQELKIITDYIDLEKLRYDETLRINFNYDIEDLKQALPPLLLMPLVENAFKHGVSETRDNPFTDIHLSVNQRQLTFVVRNSAETPTTDSVVKERIGLSNLRRQLELLYKDYNLSVKQGVSEFTATLKINLASHV